MTIQREGNGNFSKTHGMTKTPEHLTWKNMRQRCFNPNRKDYINYGGRGITVCEEWDSFENFYKDMGDKPDGLTLERVDNNKGYYKDNCVWDTRLIQSRNRRVYKNGVKVTGVYQRLNGAYRVVVDYKSIHYELGTFIKLWDAICARKSWESKIGII